MAPQTNIIRTSYSTHRHRYGHYRSTTDNKRISKYDTPRTPPNSYGPHLTQKRLDYVADHLGDFGHEKTLLSENQELRELTVKLMANERVHELETSMLDNRIRHLKGLESEKREKIAKELRVLNYAHNKKMKRIHSALAKLGKNYGIDDVEENDPSSDKTWDSRRHRCSLGTLAEWKINKVDDFIDARRDSFDEHLSDEKAAHKADLKQLQAMIDRMTEDEERFNAELMEKVAQCEDVKDANLQLRREWNAERAITDSKLNEQKAERKDALDDALWDFSSQLNDRQVSHEKETAKFEALIAKLKTDAALTHSRCLHDEISRLRFVIGSLETRQERINRAATSAEHEY